MEDGHAEGGDHALVDEPLWEDGARDAAATSAPEATDPRLVAGHLLGHPPHLQGDRPLGVEAQAEVTAHLTRGVEWGGGERTAAKGSRVRRA